MNHILIIILFYLALVFGFCFYEYYYKKKILEKFENNGNWDDKIGLQVLRDMLGVFFNESEKSFNIPGGLSVQTFFPVYEDNPAQRSLVALQFQRGTLDNGTRMRYNVLSLSY
jgi:hypothetical protein